MAGVHHLAVEADDAGLRLDAWLAARLPELSRSRVQALIEQGHVRLDGRATRASARLRAGQVVDVEIPSVTPAVPQPENIPLDIVHEDARLLVVDKPAGLVVHPGAGRPSGTLVNALLHHVKDLSGVGGVLRPGIVHRLDRGTSGLLVVAKDDATHRALAKQFASRSVEKEYLAIVLGVPSRTRGMIAAAIGRDPVHRQRMSVRATRGRAATSDYDGRVGAGRRRAAARDDPHRAHAPDPRAPRVARASRGRGRGLRRHTVPSSPRAARARPCAVSSGRPCMRRGCRSRIPARVNASRSRARCRRTWRGWWQP